MSTREVKRSELSGVFLLRDPEWRKKIFFGGLLLLLLHPIGWPAALGYRKQLISNLSAGKDPLLPEWKGNITHYFTEGLRAMGVIFGYLSPLYLALLFLLLSNGVAPGEYWLYTAVFFCVCMIFSTLSFPSILIYWTFFSEQYQVPIETCFALLLAFSLIIFFIPAGFLQVSMSGRYLSAFNIPAAISTLTQHFRAYVRAWYHSALMSLCGHFAIPFAPWGVVWCYLGIIFEFNSILHGAPVGAAPSWFERFRHEERLMLRATHFQYLYECLNPADNLPCFLLKLGPILIPLPSLVVKCLSLENTN